MSTEHQHVAHYPDAPAIVDSHRDDSRLFVVLNVDYETFKPVVMAADKVMTCLDERGYLDVKLDISAGTLDVALLETVVPTATHRVAPREVTETSETLERTYTQAIVGEHDVYRAETHAENAQDRCVLFLTTLLRTHAN